MYNKYTTMNHSHKVWHRCVFNALGTDHDCLYYWGFKKHSREIKKIKVVPIEANISVSQNSSYNS